VQRGGFQPWVAKGVEAGMVERERELKSPDWRGIEMESSRSVGIAVSDSLLGGMDLYLRGILSGPVGLTCGGMCGCKDCA
jgi:hypothetical protein